jgi:hypothetical protein
MLFGDDRESLRRAYLEAWRQHRDGQPLEPLAAQLVDVIALHPEYHSLVEAGEESLARDWRPEDGATNPFLHMGLHLAIRDQVRTDRPAGIAAIYWRLAGRSGDAHQTEHVMLECLGETLWRAQRDNRPPDEAAYLDALSRL